MAKPKKQEPLKVDNLRRLLRAVSKVELKSILVGIPEEKTDRKESDGITNAMIGYLAEHGSPANNIPQRAWLAPGIQKAAPKTEKYLANAARLTINGGTQERIDRQLHLAGLHCVNVVRAGVNEGIEPELAQSTLAARRAAGFKGTKPLVVTGQFRNSITYVLKDKDK